MGIVKNETLLQTLSHVLGRRLVKSFSLLENYLLTTRQPRALERLSQLRTDYQLMVDYWQSGYDDPERRRLYERLLRGTYTLTTDTCVRLYRQGSSFLRDTYIGPRTRRSDWTLDAVRTELENFVTGTAVLELEPEHTRAGKLQQLHSRHEQFQEDLFDYVWTSKQWSDGVTDGMIDLLLSPTIESTDQQLIVSAITLSAINFFCFNKFRLLATVYRMARDERVRQRALIGWVFSMDEGVAAVYTEMADVVAQMMSDERCAGELAELQMQLVYCLQAESDTQKIQSEIMPELLKNNHIKITRNGIEETDDDPMDDVLHPELAEQRMEKLEKYVAQMADMQRQGSDIYFGGFSQMKRFPFFTRIANWFMPFTMQHTAVSQVLGRVKGGKFLRMMLEQGPFCDSDKFSFVMAFESVMSHLPEQLQNMLDRGEATMVGADTLESSELESPAFLRRSYLQSIYRFYRVFPQRAEFNNPFEAVAHPRYCFFANKLLSGTLLEQRFGEVVAFFIKHKCHDMALLTLQNYSMAGRDKQFFLLNGQVLAKTRQDENAGLTAVDSFRQALGADPFDERVWRGYARALFASGDYAASLEYYTKLAERHTDHQGYQLNMAVCMTNLGDSEAALKILFKLNYEAPDDAHISRALAWTLVCAKRYDQAATIYDRLLGEEPPAADDVLNAAYCKWFGRHTQEAIRLFKAYIGQSENGFDANREFFDTEAGLIRQHGVEEVEVRLMADLLS